jgi:hypothetical protein
MKNKWKWFGVFSKEFRDCRDLKREWEIALSDPFYVIILCGVVFFLFYQIASKIF